MELDSTLTLARPYRRPYSVPALRQDTLPFVVRLAESRDDILKAVHLRAQAYGRHLPEVGQLLMQPEADDWRDDVLLLIAESKLDRSVLGSIRLHPNWLHPLRIQGEFEMPAHLRGRRLLELMRLTVRNGLAGKLVMGALAKASFEICAWAGIDAMLVAGRFPVSAMYEAMQFDDLLHGATVPLSYAAGVPHGIYALPIAEVETRLRKVGHWLYPFIAHTEHRDIQLDYRSEALQKWCR
ncbi:N-acyl amino acid synthase FeeM domain-containing protein [Aquabacterium sp. J223]|uniref:N-acyl amino acid synthase FeeM domain-containing protein n=1 Tax=Aquabacterium sp. J223 TaxID=2898431 RepID=UPI0021ADED23|nr:hypothetical protein [Aquabacterium sp. J223]UUX97153.1 hypothetical protein LRS07_07900 [Aquabacterium sp. J223]